MTPSRHHLNILARMLWPRRRTLLVMVLCVFSVSGLFVLVPLWGKHLVKTVLPAGDFWVLLRHLLWGLLLGLGLQLLLFANNFIRLSLSHRIAAGLRGRLFDKILHLPLREYPKYQSGDFMSRLSNDINVLQQGLIKGIFNFFPNLIYLCFLVVLMFWYSVPLTAIALLLVAPLGWTISHFVGRIRALARVSQEKVAVLNVMIEETFRGIREIKSYGQEDTVRRHFDRQNRASLQAAIKQDLIGALNPGIVLLITLVGVFLLVFLCTWMVKSGWLLLEDLVAFLACLLLAFSPIQELTASFAFLGRIIAVMDRFEEMMGLPSERLGSDGKPALPPVRGRIELQGVGFSYGGRFALQDVNVTIAAGEKVGIVGPSGSGKTTLLNLIPRFLDVDSGRIRVDGHDITEYNLDSLRRQIGFVSQEPVIFDGTLMENLRFARPRGSTADMLRAARAAHVDDFVRDFRQGYDTRVGQYGSQLSAGQRQRIAIARALLSGAKILLLDEPTSALDMESEQVIQDSLGRLFPDRTLLVVGHRLSMVKQTDRILVIQNGRLVEQGSHSDLIREKGLYHRLFQNDGAWGGNT